VVIVGRSAVMAISFRFFPELTGSPPTPLCGSVVGSWVVGRGSGPTAECGGTCPMAMKFNLEAVFGVWRGPGLRHSPQDAGPSSRVCNSDYESAWHNHTH
jgi:hypothetical protein